MDNYSKSLYKIKKNIYNREKLNEKAFIEDNAFTTALQRELQIGGREGKPVKDITSPADLTKFLTLYNI